MTNGDDTRAPEAGRYASVNGLEMYYEIHGSGPPLVLLHGAFSAIGTSFGELLPALAETRQVIAFAGPPKLMKPSFTQNQNASQKPTGLVWPERSSPTVLVSMRPPLL